MKALIFSQYFWPETFSINDVAITLKEKGVDVTVLTGQPNYPAGKLYEGYRWRGFQTERYHDINLLRVPLIPRSKGALGLILNYLSFIFSAILFAPFRLRYYQYDVIFVYGISPILSALPALFLGRLRSVPVVLWVQDLWPESLEATGYVKNKFILSLVEKIVRFIYHRSDLLLVQSEAFIDEVKMLAGSTPVIYYPNSVDPSFARTVDVADRPLAGLDDKFIILFAGNIGKAQAVKTIIETARKLKTEDDIQFVLVGDGSMREWALKEIKAHQLRNVSMPGKFPIEQMPAFMNQANALLVSLRDEPIFAKTIPNKVQAYLAVGRPIVACLNGEGARIVKQAGAGVTVMPENADALAKACRKLYRMSDNDRVQMGKNGRSYFMAHYMHDRLIDQLIQLLKGVQKG